jgi:hypothetical protein
MSSGEPRPWWASSGAGPERIDPDEDPVTAHRAARRGDEDVRGTESSADAGRDHAAEVCGVCPICVGMRLLGEARPDLVVHLTEAARHLSAAVRSLLDTTQDPGPPDGEGVRRIDLD